MRLQHFTSAPPRSFASFLQGSDSPMKYSCFSKAVEIKPWTERRSFPIIEQPKEETVYHVSLLLVMNLMTQTLFHLRIRNATFAGVRFSRQSMDVNVVNL